MEHKEFWYGLYADSIAQKVERLEKALEECRQENERLRARLEKREVGDGGRIEREGVQE